MNEIIKIAIEKGDYHGLDSVPTTEYGEPTIEDQRELVLDPLFWQALGKALGWDDRPHSDVLGQPKWLYHSRRYHTEVMTGGSTEKFWKDLINPK